MFLLTYLLVVTFHGENSQQWWASECVIYFESHLSESLNISSSPSSSR